MTQGYDPTAPYTAPPPPQRDPVSVPADQAAYWEVVQDLIALGCSPAEAREAFNVGMDTIEGQGPGAPAPPVGAPPQAGRPLGAAGARAAAGTQNLTRGEFEQLMAHDRCTRALAYDPATVEVARAWVDSKVVQASQGGHPITIETAYQLFDHWRRQSAAAHRVTAGQVAGGPQPPGGSPVVTYPPPAHPSFAGPAAPTLGPEPGVVPRGAVAAPALATGQAGHPGQTALSLEMAARAREAARMTGSPGAGGGGGVRPGGGGLPNNRFEELGALDPHSAEFLDMVNDAEVARQLRSLGEVPME